MWQLSKTKTCNVLGPPFRTARAQYFVPVAPPLSLTLAEWAPERVCTSDLEVRTCVKRKWTFPKSLSYSRMNRSNCGWCELLVVVLMDLDVFWYVKVFTGKRYWWFEGACCILLHGFSISRTISLDCYSLKIFRIIDKCQSIRRKNLAAPVSAVSVRIKKILT